MVTRRYDLGTFKQPVITQQGYLKVDAYITRAGIFSYMKADGTVIRELRPQEEVFKAESLDSAKEIPVTNDHPPVMLTSANTRQYACGWTNEKVEQDGDFIKAGVTITDADLIADITDRGKVETSCGYHCNIDPTPGVWHGIKYDAVQRDITYNHLSVVDKGRAGPDVRLRLDADDAVMVMDDGNDDNREMRTKTEKPKKEDKLMVQITLDGISYELEDNVANAVKVELKKKEDAFAELKASFDTAKKDKEELQGKYDVLSKDVEKKDEEIKGLKEKSISREDAMKIAKTRFDVEAKVKKVLAKEELEKIDFDNASDLELKKAVLTKTNPDMKLDDADENYVDGAFSMIKVGDKDPDANKFKQNLQNDAHNDGADKYDSIAAKKRSMAKSRDLWKDGMRSHQQ